MIEHTDSGFCNMCGHHVAKRVKAHIIDKRENYSKGLRNNYLDLCPSCHEMFDRNLKPKLYDALHGWQARGAKLPPRSWNRKEVEKRHQENGKRIHKDAEE